MAVTVINACTIIAAHQLAAARALAESFFAHHPDGSFTVLIVDDERREIAPDGEIDRRVAWWRLADLGLETADIRKLTAVYDVAELGTAVEPLLLKTLMRAHESAVIYLDPGGRVLDSLEDLSRVAGQYAIAVAPSAEPSLDSWWQQARRQALDDVPPAPSVRAPSTAPALRWVTSKEEEDDRVPARATAAPSRGPWRDRTVALLLALCCFAVYNANGRAIATGDTYAARYQPFAIWKHHTLFLDPIEALVSQGRELPASALSQPVGSAYWIVPVRKGRHVSLYPAVVPVLIAPLYIPAVTYVAQRGWTDQRVDVAARIMEKLAASFIAALSVALLFLALRRRTTRSNAVLLAVAYAFGTSTWVISSQALWQHGMAQVLIAAAILLLTGPCTTVRAFAVGVLCGLIAVNRPPDAVLVAALGAYGLFWAGRRAALVIAAAAVPALLVVLYNVSTIGPLAGAYGLLGRPQYFLRHDFASGLAGLLFSPARGLFVFSPFLLFLALAWRHRPHDRAERGLTLLMAAAVVAQVLLYSLTDWRAGLSWGPRFLTDMLPMLMWMLVPVVAALGRPGRACFAAAVCVGIAIESVGAFTYTGITDAAIYVTADGRLAPLRAAWTWRNAPFIAPLWRGIAPAELLQPMVGSLDVVEANGQATTTLRSGQNVVVKGWALAGRFAPLQVAIAIDGRVTETSVARTFFDRPDVRDVFPDTEPAGWEIPLDTAGLAAGQHRLSLYSWASDQTDAYFLATRTVTVQMNDGDLDASAMVASARIRQHQQGPGYWLTAFTNVTRFEKPRDEMNTFMTSLLVDLLDPLPAAARLGDSVQRARRHLTAQIEANGLVRYHGPPDAPGIGTLGCAITPDTDDTALVWRIAPAEDRQRLSAALATLSEYRRSDGLYHTWLAPRSAYQCLDPGRDPNPADVTIQMHLLELLLAAKLPEARGLCDALGRHVADDRIWVYYERTSLVPMLRVRDLERAGCPLVLPASRMQTNIPGQEIWISVVQLLLRSSRTDGPRPDAAEVTKVLETLARDDFALLRTNPPLLYHNDLTATVPRYYWSQDVGYALWLRLAHAR